MGRTGFGTLMAAAVAALVGGSTARATDPTCLAQAKQAVVACRAQCKDDFATSRFACRGVDPSCGKACLAGREVCLDAVGQPLTDCVAACRSTLQVDKAACQAGDDACINAAQVKAFVCRDTCRDTWRADPTTTSGLATCKTSFRACVHACPAS